MTPSLSAGGEVFWLPQQMRSGVGLCLRHTGDKHIAAVQLATTGILSAQYAHRVTDKVWGVGRCWGLCGGWRPVIEAVVGVLCCGCAGWETTFEQNNNTSRG